MESMAERTAGFECVACRLESHVAVVTLNRPHRRNALNYQAYGELETALRAASDDPLVRCVVVTGADPAFCSGDDVGEIMAGPTAVSAAPAAKAAQPTPPAMPDR